MKKLLLDLVHAESESDVTSILDAYPIAREDANWRAYGDIKNNFGTIGSQQAEPYSALVEKLVNSIDAVLILKCLESGIRPESEQAPRNMREAVELFLGVREGNLANITASERTGLAEQIKLVSTGPKRAPSLIIDDLGEGQTPEQFPNTFLSLHAENKIRIPFVQGKFNMGGTGVLLFCGEDNNYQLILSRRHPKLWQKPTDSAWGFTIIRRRPPHAGTRSSMFEYLAPNGMVPYFEADSLPVTAGSYPHPYGQPKAFGTLIKLYGYQIPNTGPIFTELYRILSRRMHRMALPVRLLERRSGYTAHTPEVTLAGMSVRIDTDRAEVVEQGPIGGPLRIPGIGDLKVSMTLFKSGKGKADSRWLISSECIFFTVNGQTHATIGDNFYRRSAVKLDWLNSDLMVEVDCSEIGARVREDLFMTSRDRMRRGSAQSKIEDALENELANHPALREWNQKRRQDAIKEAVTDERPTIEILAQLIRSSPDLASLFGVGTKISNPFKPDGRGINYIGREFPTYFRLAKGESGSFLKECPVNSTCRVLCETDAANDYLVREKEPGSLTCEPSEVLVSSSLWNGKMTITLRPPANAIVGGRFGVTLSLMDDSRVNPLDIELTLQIGDVVIKGKNTPSPRQSENEQLALPSITRVEKHEWHEFGFNPESAILFRNNGESGLDAIVNIDNIHLERELVQLSRMHVEPQLVKRQYELGLLVTGLALREKLEGDENREEILAKMTSGIAKIILPTIRVLSQIGDTVLIK